MDTPIKHYAGRRRSDLIFDHRHNADVRVGSVMQPTRTDMAPSGLSWYARASPGWERERTGMMGKLVSGSMLYRAG
jgi:hypothetical protein